MTTVAMIAASGKATCRKAIRQAERQIPALHFGDPGLIIEARLRVGRLDGIQETVGELGSLLVAKVLGRLQELLAHCFCCSYRAGVQGVAGQARKVGAVVEKKAAICWSVFPADCFLFMLRFSLVF